MGRPMTELELAIAQIDCHKHWTIRTRNRIGQREGYECVIWGEGRRVTGSGPTPLRAIRRAIEKLKSPRPKRVKPQPERPAFGIVG